MTNADIPEWKRNQLNSKENSKLRNKFLVVLYKQDSPMDKLLSSYLSLTHSHDCSQ
jgi:hypothetical protein